MVTQLCEYIKNHWIVALNRWIVWYMNYTSLKLLFKEISMGASSVTGWWGSNLLLFYHYQFFSISWFCLSFCWWLPQAPCRASQSTSCLLPSSPGGKSHLCPYGPHKNLISLCWFWLGDEKVLKPNSLYIGGMGQGWKGWGGLGSVDSYLEKQINVQWLPGQMSMNADKQNHVYLL